MTNWAVFTYREPLSQKCSTHEEHKLEDFKEIYKNKILPRVSD
jgi:hypothetical protein